MHSRILSSRRSYLGASLLTLLVLLGAGRFPARGQVMMAPSSAAPVKLTPQAMAHLKAQIDIANADKAARTPTQDKISSQFLYAAREERTGVALKGVETMHAAVAKETDGTVLVDINATVTPGLLLAIKTLGGVVVNSFPAYDSIRARMPLQQLETLAAREDVRSIRPGLKAVVNAYAGEGIAAHQADLVQNNYSVPGSPSTKVTGAGILVGVLSDSDDYAAAAENSHDLPDNVLELSGQGGRPATGEGTAMMEIVHDIAPGANLIFATGDGGEAAMATNIKNLQGQGCKIIIDDISYYDENPFTPNVVGQAIRDACAKGVVYFSSAANSGNATDLDSGCWEGDFVASSDPTILSWNQGDQYNKIVGLSVDSKGNPDNPIYLFWADVYGHTADDYDLYTYDDNGNVIWPANDRQNGTGNPVETIPASKLHLGDNLIVVKYSGAVRCLHVDAARNHLKYITPGNTRGHNAPIADGAFCVAATPAANFRAKPTGPYPNAFDSTDQVELFSSDGPRRRFFDDDGKEYTPGNRTSTGGKLFAKPDFTAADGVKNSGVYADPALDPFFGTSAAAPHAGAIAALILSYDPNLTNVQVGNLMKNTAIDIMGAGWDRDSGYGIVMPSLAIQGIAPVITPTPTDYTFNVPQNAATSTQSFSLQIKDDGYLALNYSIDNEADFVTIASAQTSGTVAPGKTGTVTVTLNNSVANGKALGSYQGFLYIQDQSGVSTKTVSIELNVTDSSGPSVAVNTPANGSVIQAFTTVQGTADDASGIQSNVVTFNLYNVNSNSYWTGSGWSSSAVNLISPYDPSTGTWKWGGKLPNAADGTLRTGPYTLSAFATDGQGNQSPAQSGVNNITFTVDNSPPTLVINNPANGSTIVSLGTLSGTSIDDTKTGGVVDLFLHRLSDNSYWDGSEWVAFTGTYPVLQASYDPQSGAWSYGGNLPQPGSNTTYNLTNGSYELIAVAQDAAGNQSQVSNTFTEDFAFVWTGATLRDSDPNNDSNAWTNPSNWSPASVPGSGDRAIINNGDAVDLVSDHMVRALVLGGGSTLNNHKLTVLGAGSVFNGGTMNGTTFVVSSGASMTIDTTGQPTLNGATLNNAGTITVNASNANDPEAINGTSSTINNQSGGVIQFARDGSIFRNISTTPVVNNSGTITKTVGTGTTYFGSYTFNNQANASFGAATGTLIINDGATLAGGSKITGPGSVLLQSGVTFNGQTTVTADLRFQTDMSFNSATLVQGTGGRLRWDNGTFSGTLTLPAADTLEVDTTGQPTVNTLTLNNSGKLLISASNANDQESVNGTSSTLNNLSGGVIQILRDGLVFRNISTTPLISNKAGGTILKTTASTGRSEINFVLDNAGTVEADAGTLAMSAGSSSVGNSGTFLAKAAGTQIEFPSGQFTLNSGTSFSGAGIILLSGAELTLKAPVTTGTGSAAAGGFVQTGGTLDGTGSLSILANTGTARWSAGTLSTTYNVPANAKLAIDTTGQPTLNVATLNNAGTITINASNANDQEALNGTSSTINNQSGGVIQLARDGSIFRNISTPPTLNNSGTITKTVGTGTTDFGSYTFNNQASASFGAATGTLVISNGATLAAGSKITGPGAVLLQSGITFNGQTTITADTRFQTSMTFNSATLTQGSGGRLRWDNGTFSGTLAIPAGTKLEIDTTGQPTVNSLTLNNSGTLAVSASNASDQESVNGTSSTLNNLSGGVIQILRDGLVFRNISTTPLISNKAGGTILKTTASTGRSEINFVLDNAGTVEADAGTLAMSAGSSTVGSTGLFKAVSASGNIEFSAGNFHSQGGG